MKQLWDGNYGEGKLFTYKSCAHCAYMAIIRKNI